MKVDGCVRRFMLSLRVTECWPWRFVRIRNNCCSHYLVQSLQTDIKKKIIILSHMQISVPVLLLVDQF